MGFNSVILDIIIERTRQDAKWGASRNLHHLEWLGIAIEEIGEASKAILENDDDGVKHEVIHAAAVLVAWLECMEQSK